MIGGGDVHRSLMSPSYSGSISFRVSPRRPGFASERKETMTAWWLAAVRTMKHGGNCRHQVVVLAYVATELDEPRSAGPLSIFVVG